MPHGDKLDRLTWRAGAVRRRFLPAALLASWLGAAGASAGAGGLPVPWREGLMESHRYTMEMSGEPKGEIEQRLYGVATKEGRRCRLVYEVVRSLEMAQDMEMTGRINMEVTFDPETFDLIQRTDYFAGGEMEGRVKFTRTPGGIRIRSESSFQGIPRETEEREVEYNLDGPLIDHVLFTHYIRSLAMEEGQTFEVQTVNPTLKDVNRNKGLVRGVETIQWHGQPVQVRRVETSTALGISSYYVGLGQDRVLYRYVSPQGEAYILQPASGSPSG